MDIQRVQMVRVIMTGQLHTYAVFWLIKGSTNIFLKMSWPLSMLFLHEDVAENDNNSCTKKDVNTMFTKKFKSKFRYHDSIITPIELGLPRYQIFPVILHRWYQRSNVVFVFWSCRAVSNWQYTCWCYITSVSVNNAKTFYIYITLYCAWNKYYFQKQYSTTNKL